MNCRVLVILICLVFCLKSSYGLQSDPPSESTQWYKGNLHTHSLWSDGNDFPEMITRWYVEHDYHFLTMTDHNILSEGERWFRVADLKKRGAESAIEKYIAAFGDQWVETETNEAGDQRVRLKTLDEYRGKFEQAGKFMLMTGEEISDSVDGLPIHMNATNLKRLLRPAGGENVREVMSNNLRAAMEQAKAERREILVHLNHPNFGWAVTAEDLAFVTMEKFFEVYNGHPGVNQNGDNVHASVERIWDIANTIRIANLDSAPLFGMGTDDCHYYHGRPGSQPGRGWIMVRAAELTSQSLIRAINQGDFYSSSGVVLSDVIFDKTNGEYRVEIEPQDGEEYTTQFIGTLKGYDTTTRQHKDKDGNAIRATRIYSDEVGKVLKEVKGASPSYRLTGNELYVRAVITSSAAHQNESFKGQKKQAWTQPVGWRDSK